MNTKLICLVMLAITLNACKKDKDEPVKEVPDGIIRTDTGPTLYPEIVNLLPDAKSVLKSYPALFADTVLKKIVLTEASDIYITFIAEKAKYKNTVGWYSYPLGSEPASIDDINIHVLFPNASGKDEGGELLQGDMLRLGDTPFPKNTVIGFFLIIKGWQYGTIDYAAPTCYTDYSLNTGGFQQHVLFRKKEGGDIVLGFEDMPFEQSDKDFNDILFTISDNKEGYENIYIDLARIPEM